MIIRTLERVRRGERKKKEPGAKKGDLRRAYPTPRIALSVRSQRFLPHLVRMHTHLAWRAPGEDDRQTFRFLEQSKFIQKYNFWYDYFLLKEEAFGWGGPEGDEAWRDSGEALGEIFSSSTQFAFLNLIHWFRFLLQASEVTFFVPPKCAILGGFGSMKNGTFNVRIRNHFSIQIPPKI